MTNLLCVFPICLNNTLLTFGIVCATIVIDNKLVVSDKYLEGNNFMGKREKIISLMDKYMKQENLSVRSFTDEFNKPIVEAGARPYSFQAIGLWHTGNRQPSDDRLMWLADHATGWVRDWAMETLAILRESEEAVK